LYSAIEDGSVECVDLSHPLSDATPIIELPEPYANTPGWSLEEVSNYDERGPLFYWNSFRGSEHMGTHFDAPVHWITGRDREDVSQIPPERLIGPAVVIDRTKEVAANRDYLLTLADIQAFEKEHGPLPKGGWLLFRTGWCTRYWDRSAFLERDGRAPTGPASIPSAPASWPRRRNSAATGSSRSASTRASRMSSTRPGPLTTTCSEPASSGWPSLRTWSGCRRSAACSSRRRYGSFAAPAVRRA
jgi:kynurenine formamidase